MLYPIFGVDGTPSTSATNYNFIHAAQATSWQTSDGAVSIPLAGAVDVSALSITLTTAPGSGKSWDFTVMKNGVATAITINITGTAVSGAYLGAAVSFAEGDTISLRSVPNSTPTASGVMTWKMEFSGTGQLLLGGSVTAASTSAANFSVITGGSSSNMYTVEGNANITIPTNGTLSKMYVRLGAAPGALSSYTIVPMVNNAAFASISVSISGAATTTGNDTAHSGSVTAGQTLSVRFTPATAPASPVNQGWSLLFTPTIDGESFYGFGSTVNLSTSATQFDGLLSNGANSYSATANQWSRPGAFTITGIYVRLSAAPGASTSRTIAIYNSTGGAATAATVTISGTNTTGNTTGVSVTPAASDKISIQSTLTGTPAASQLHYGVLVYSNTSVTIAPNDVAIGTTIDNTTITQNHIVATQDSAVGTTIDATTISQDHIVVPQDVAMATSTDNTTLTQDHVVASGDVFISSSTDNATITQEHIIATQDVAVSTTTDNTTVDQSHLIVPDDIAIGTSTDNTSITQDQVIVPNDLLVSTSTDNATINQNHVITTQDISLALGVDGTLIDGVTIEPDDVTIGASSGGVTYPSIIFDIDGNLYKRVTSTKYMRV
jgi:hypothetical protein